MYDIDNKVVDFIITNIDIKKKILIFGINQNASLNGLLIDKICLFAWWCLTPLSIIFQLYRGGLS
jgi:hypothetical protein